MRRLTDGAGVSDGERRRHSFARRSNAAAALRVSLARRRAARFASSRRRGVASPRRTFLARAPCRSTICSRATSRDDASSTLIPIALLGGVLGLDVVSFPQAMISRPLVAATLAGALIGEAASGVLLGAALELIALETLPFGASRYPEWGSASVVGGAIFASHPAHPAGRDDPRGARGARHDVGRRLDDGQAAPAQCACGPGSGATRSRRARAAPSFRCSSWA